MVDHQDACFNDILTLEEASRLFHVSTKTFLKLLREEEVPARKVGREWRFSKEALLKWISEGNSRNYASAEDDNRAYFEQLAPVYDELRTGCYAEALSGLLLSHFTLPPDGEVADIGSGTGYLAKALAAHVKKVWAIDASLAMLEVFRQDLALTNIINIEIAQGDVHDLPLKAKSLDMIFANLLLHHLLDPKSAISEMFRVLKTGGRIVITDVDAHSHQWLKVEKSDIWLGFDRIQMENWLKTVGFNQVEISDLDYYCKTSDQTGNCIEIPMFMATACKR